MASLFKILPEGGTAAKSPVYGIVIYAMRMHGHIRKNNVKMTVGKWNHIATMAFRWASGTTYPWLIWWNWASP